MKLTEVKSALPGAKAYIGEDGLSVLVSTDNTPKWSELLHVSISRPDKYPSWDEIIEIKLKFFGDKKDSMMIIPKRENYVNIHNNCFHLWECPESWNLM